VASSAGATKTVYFSAVPSAAATVPTSPPMPTPIENR
jgi:hypothetical protein